MDGHQTLRIPHRALRARIEHGAPSRLGRIVCDLTDALADVVEKHRVSPAELREAMYFAVDVGMATDDRRNEWVLLLDAIGITGAAHRASLNRPAGSTPQTLLGPFFRGDAPIKKSGDSISIDQVGTPLTLHVEVTDLDGVPIPDAVVHVWQANCDGLFENQDPDSQPEFNLRGRFHSGPDGRVTIRTVRPAGYSLPDDGPVARLMKQLGLPMTRPAHIQFRIEAPRFQTLVTQVFDRVDPNIDADPLFCVSPELLADFGDPAAPGGCSARITFKLARSRPGVSPH